ncbi:MAG: MBL fold metallo-hydrolase [Armatimonadota bacterium]|nr:MBL fold metallo-hydrolase [Armatimonadota bacterium]MDR7484978.1 MBL fold metallo-hydrolase [Armatimonadota bacterium]
MTPVHWLADDLVLIDTLYQETERAVGAYLLLGRRPALIETGPASRVETLLAGVRAAGLDPAALQAVAVTHIHLDHAGAAGALVRRFPHLEVYVHPIGAPHLADPSRLVASAGRLYGDRLGPLFGDVVPVPADRIRPLDDGTAVALGSRRLVALESPGHARHHLVYHDAARGELFTGDAAGVALPGRRAVRAPTPPPELDIPAWLQTLERLRTLRPRRLLLTHFGPHDWADGLLSTLAAQLQTLERLALEAVDAGLDEPSALARLARAVAGSGQDQASAAAAEDRAGAAGQGAGSDAERLEVIMASWQSAQGLLRYARTRRER